MSKRLLRAYIRATLAETADARVPNQLIAPGEDEENGSSEEDSGETLEVNEFCGVGSVAGFSAPLGMDPDKLGRKKNSR